MKYVCDAPAGKTWFRIETEAEAASESDVMRHAVEKFFRKEQEKATQTLSTAVQGLLRAGDRAQGAHSARDAAVPDLARRRRHAAGHRHAAAGRAGRPQLPADHRRHGERRPLCRARRRDPARWASISASRSSGRAATPTAATDTPRPDPTSRASCPDGPDQQVS